MYIHPYIPSKHSATALLFVEVSVFHTASLQLAFRPADTYHVHAGRSVSIPNRCPVIDRVPFLLLFSAA